MSPPGRTDKEQLSDSEDWTKLTDISQRRRIQNRLAQRARRKKLRSRGNQEPQPNRASPSVSRSPEATPEPSGSTQWPMSLPDTKALLAQIDQTRKQLHDYLSGISHGDPVQPPSQDCYWDSELLGTFDANDLSTLSHSLDQLDSIANLTSMDSAFDDSSLDQLMTGHEFAICASQFTTPTMGTSHASHLDPFHSKLGKANQNFNEPNLPVLEICSEVPQNSGTDLHGNTALHIAAQNGHQAIIRLLVETGAVIDTSNSDGLSALQIATSTGKTAIAKLLLELGANSLCTTPNAQTLLHLAVTAGNLELVQLVLQYPVDTSVRDHIGETALHAAVASGHEDIVRLMLSKGINSQARVGIKTPVDTSFDWNMITGL